MKTYKPILILLGLLTIILASCSSSPPVAVIMTGNWSMSMTNYANENKSVTLDLNLVQSGSSLSGTAYVDDTYFGSINGTRDGGNFDFTLSNSLANFEVTGKTTSLNSFTGSYTASGGGYGPVSGSR